MDLKKAFSKEDLDDMRKRMVRSSKVSKNQVKDTFYDPEMKKPKYWQNP